MKIISVTGGERAACLLGLMACPAVAARRRPSTRRRAKRSPARKRAAVNSIDKQAGELTDIANRIWEYAELALREHRSAAALADHAEKQGFRVERGVAGMPTAFVATYGSGRPVIGILGEYDALPGISQKASPVKEPLQPGAGGHGCGHNLFGAASLGAAIAIKEQIAAGKLKGTVRFYGTPAEEDITAARSTWRARDCSTASTPCSHGIPAMKRWPT